MQYLKEKQYYIDLYDKITIEKCRDFEEFLLNLDLSKYEGDLSEEERLSNFLGIANLCMYLKSGSLWERKEDAIEEWMERDKEKDKLLNNATPAKNIKCDECGSEMKPSREETTLIENRVVFFHFCPNDHLPGKVVYENGEIWKNKNPDADVDIDLELKEEKEDPHFKRDKKRFVFSDEKGKKYLESQENIKGLEELMDKIEEKKKNKEIYNRVEELDKLTFPALKKYLVSELEDTGFSNLEFEKPDMGRNVTVRFSVEDNKERDGYNARMDLKKLLNKILKDTNWRLMSDGISERVGILSSRLRVYEGEDSLVKLIKRENG